ncbi:MAG: peptide-methionine (S)-S-oxide reductase MsrA [Candidatus Taylorbacteria bacterium]
MRGKTTNKEVAVFANGCFWCTEAVFSSLKGVSSVSSGYTDGTVAHPTYEQVSNGNTGHAECIKIEYDPAIITYDDLLAVFFNTHNPTTLNRQGNDIGTQYRSAIFYTTPEQKEKAEALITELNASHAYDVPVVTKVQPLTEFYSAEEYHAQYYAKHKNQPYCELIIAPKLEKLQKQFAQLIA